MMSDLRFLAKTTSGKHYSPQKNAAPAQVSAIIGRVVPDIRRKRRSLPTYGF